VFDTKKQYTIRILSGGVKECLVRFPTDEEWCARTRRQKIVRQQVTGGKFRTEVLNAEKADAELLDKIRMDDKSVAFTESEASKVIGRLEGCEIIDAIREGDGFCIEIKTLGQTLKHWVRIPTEDENRKFSRNSTHPISAVAWKRPRYPWSRLVSSTTRLPCALKGMKRAAASRSFTRTWWWLRPCTKFVAWRKNWTRKDRAGVPRNSRPKIYSKPHPGNG
jgi:hypothetical protein